jgi:TfoX/Sxy family transcriptional regulator of competence genes
VSYDERLAEEVRDRLAAEDFEVVEKAMFGGLGFMVDGNLAVAASRRGGLLVRTDPADSEDLLERPGVEPMETRGRPMPGWLFVGPEGLDDTTAVDDWIDRALAFVATLPPK